MLHVFDHQRLNMSGFKCLQTMLCKIIPQVLYQGFILTINEGPVVSLHADRLDEAVLIRSSYHPQLELGKN